MACVKKLDSLFAGCPTDTGGGGRVDESRVDNDDDDDDEDGISRV